MFRCREHKTVRGDAAADTVPFRPTRLVIVIEGSARRIFGRCHRSSQGPPPAQIGHNFFGAVTQDEQKFLTEWRGTCHRGAQAAGCHRHQCRRPETTVMVIRPAAAFAGSNFFCHRPPRRRGGRNGTVSWDPRRGAVGTFAKSAHVMRKCSSIRTRIG